jgi:aspartyl-tRNA(Asn)/glutamyl-tRNA(Gln) amidotransferase subunit A
MMNNFPVLTIQEAREGLEKGTWTALELCKASRQQIDAQKHLGAFLEVFEDAEQYATEADARLKKGERGPLLGIPVAIKDNLLYKGHRSGSASKILDGYTGVYDSTVVERLRKAGAVIMGRTNMDDFAMGSSNENSAYGVVKNPHDQSRVPGGSSGGSAVSVAMGGVLASLGSDTGGSIRQPASLCGVVGFKPSYGQVSRYGLMAMASSLDQIGPFGKTVADVRAIYEVIRGHDPMDATSIPESLLPTPQTKKSFRIGVPSAFVRQKGIDPDVLDAFDRAIDGLKKAGHSIVDIDLPVLDHALAVYYIIMPAEVSSNLARFDGIRYGHSYQKGGLRDIYDVSRAEGFGREVRRRILLGTYVLSSGYYDAYYDKANLVRAKIKQDLAKAFQTVDAILTPTAPTPAFRIGEKTSDPLQMYLADIFTVPANIAGVPAISVPVGTVSREGKDLPVGIQFMTPLYHDAWCFDLGQEVEKGIK